MVEMDNTRSRNTHEIPENCILTLNNRTYHVNLIIIKINIIIDINIFTLQMKRIWMKALGKNGYPMTIIL